MKKICRECGKEFDTQSSKRLYCYDDHYRVCKICGKSFLVNPNNKKITCSEDCRRKAISTSEVYRTPRFKRTCILCGKEFLSPASNSQVCSDKHYRVCVICGKSFEVNNVYQANKMTCSDECRYILSSQSFAEHKDEHLSKARATMLAKYGCESPFGVPEFQAKSRQTCLERYGVAHFTQSKQFVEAAVKTNRERYGVDWYMQTPAYKESAVKTCMEKYGTTNYSKAREHIVTKMTYPEKLDDLMRFRDNPEQYIRDNFEEAPTLKQLSDKCGIRESSVSDILHACNMFHLVASDYSKMEDEVFDFISQYISGDSIERNTFKIITPYELDIYIPDLKLAIECDPTYTHNSSIGIYKNDPVPANYHQLKTDLCEKQGVRLFHLFGYDWVNHKDVCKSMLLNSMGKTTERYYARKLDIKEVSDSEACDFLNANHRQGGVHCKVCIGLYLGDDLLSLMTFSKMRHTIGTDKTTSNDSWELVRFCNKIYTTVVGGASRLLHYFIKKYHPAEVRSFSDRAHTSGDLYPKLGFVKIRQSKPGYMWVNLKTDRAYARVNAQKRNIKRFLGDDSIDLSKTEVQIMMEHGYAQVFDSGTITWQLIIKDEKGV